MGPPPHEPPTCRCDECDLVMDFDDMPDSYFAFLSNQRKLAEPDKINGAMRDLGQAAADGKKVRSRASQPNLSSGSKPSVPSLPSIQKSSTQPASAAFTAAAQSGKTKSPTKPPSAPALNPGSRPPGSFRTGPNVMPSNSFGFATQAGTSPTYREQPKSNALVFVLIAILLAAIGVLAYLVLTK
jgi:hypothetical protein